MKNPWLDVPLDEYEGHMAWPSVGQAQLLGDALSLAIERFAPQSIAVLGCAGGNGFERIPSSVSRVVGVDLNPLFITQASERFSGRFKELELLAGDIQSEETSFAPVDLIFAGLLLEYVSVETVVARVPSMLRPSGHLVTVLQLPSAGHSAVSPSPFPGVKPLGDMMHFVPPAHLQKVAEAHGFVQLDSCTVASVADKHFQIQVFAMTPEPALLALEGLRMRVHIS